MDPIDTTTKWMKLVGDYGVSYLFMGCTVGILLYIAWTTVALMKKWVPHWFESSIASHERVAKAVEQQCSLLECIHAQTRSTRNGAQHAVQAVKSFKDLPSSVLVHLQNAERSLDEAVPNHHKRPPNE